MRFIVESVVAAVVVTLSQVLAGGLLLADQPQAPGSPAWGLASNLLIAMSATGLAQLMTIGGPRRAGLLFLVLFGIPANNLAETLFFDIGLPRTLLPRLYLFQAIEAVALAAFSSWRAGRPVERGDGAARPSGGTAWRLAVLSIAYVVLYFTAGMAVYPYVADFYAGRALPSVATLIPIQLCRGLVYSAIGLVIVASTGLRRWPVAFAVAATLAVVGGIAPLMVPNPYMPAPVRLAHGVEVGVSNFLFGLLSGWLVGRAQRQSPAAVDIMMPAK